MICEKHTRYKGLTPIGKRNAECAACHEIRKLAQSERLQKIRERDIYNSLYVSGKKVDLAHFLAEMMTDSKFKHNRKYTRPEIEEAFFLNALKMSYKWIKEKSWAANSLKGLLYMCVLQKEIQEDIPKIKVETKLEERKNEQVPTDYKSEVLADCKPKKTIFNLFEEEDGKKEG